MKKVIIIICVSLVILIAGIVILSGGNGDANVNSAKNEKKFSLTYEGVNITPGTKFKEKAIKKTATKTVIPSCANIEGEDNVYRYDNIELTATVYDTYEQVFSVYFLDDTVETNEGIKIGSTADEVRGAYKGLDDSSSTYMYEKDDVKVLFTMQDDKVVNIEFVYMYGMDNEG